MLVGRGYRRGPERAGAVAELCERIEELKMLANLGPWCADVCCIKGNSRSQWSVARVGGAHGRGLCGG